MANSFIGKSLLEIFMFSMYADARIIYREYVQNAFDSIHQAVANGTLDRVKDGAVSIQIDNQNRQVSIRDNGTGIGKDYALRVLTSIADSPKDGEEQAGVYGIGRLVGAGYCNKLEFRTSAKGEDVASIVIFDVVKTREVLDDANDRSSAAEVIDSVVSSSVREEDADEHYFEVILHDVKEDYPVLLSEDDIVEYLKEVAPIDYEMPFKNNIMYVNLDEQSDFYHCLMGLKAIKLSVNDRVDIRKRYGQSVEGTGDRIYELKYFKFEDNIYGVLAWGWFAVTEFSKAIPATDRNRGIRLRKHNIQIGNGDYLNQYFREARGNNYYYGEVHAVHENLRPNAARDGLAPTAEANVFFGMLQEYFKELKSIYTLANKAKNAARDISVAQSRVDRDCSEEERQEAQVAIDKAKKKFQAVVQSVAKTPSSQTNDTARKIIDIYEKSVGASSKEVERIGSGFLKKQSSTVRQQHGSGNNQIDSQLGIVNTNEPMHDVFQPLVDIYGREQAFMARKIFKSLSDNCPEGQLQLIEELKKMVIRDLSERPHL